jgi:hypothetical protein
MKIDRCKSCGEYIDIASDHKPDCTRNAKSQVIPDEAVEAAAKAIYATEAQPMYDEAKEQFTGARPWEWLTERSWDVYRNKARQTLEAAAPHLLANAWDEGGKAAIEREHAYGREEKAKFSNPYRNPSNAV